MAFSTKLKKIFFKLSNLYFPFNNLSPERVQEVINHVRIIELQRDEVLTIRSGRSQDYLYLLEGQIDVVCENCIQTINDPVDTQRQPLQLSEDSNNCSIIAKEDCIIGHANRDTLDTIIAWDHIGRESRDTIQFIDMIRNTLVFRRLPTEYIESAFSKMQRRQLKQGDTIEGEQIDAYYLIISGRAEVQRFNPQTQENLVVAELSIGDTFGEEALVSGEIRHESIAILEDSELLVLGKNDFQELIARPLVKTVQPQVASTMLDNGYRLLDVRFPEEYAENRIPGAQLIPLCELSSRLKELNHKQPYIIYCHSGPRSAIATLILNKNKFEALSLEGGIRDWPYEIEHPTTRSGVVPFAKKFH